MIDEIIVRTEGTKGPVIHFNILIADRDVVVFGVIRASDMARGGLYIFALASFCFFFSNKQSLSRLRIAFAVLFSPLSRWSTRSYSGLSGSSCRKAWLLVGVAQ